MFVSKETLFDLLIASEQKNSNTCNFIKAWYYSIIDVVNFLLCFIWKLNFIMGIYVCINHSISGSQYSLGCQISRGVLKYIIHENVADSYK